MKTLALVTARAGSKSVPNKNIIPFGDDTALSLRIKSARLADPKIDIIISTDSKEYADIAIKAGAECLFLRPSELSSDAASSSDVLIHAIEAIKTLGRTYDFLVLVEPSSPFCRPEDFRRGLDMLWQSRGPVVSVREVNPHPMFVCEMGDEGQFDQIARNIAKTKDIRRQAQKPCYTPNGCFYGATVGDFLIHKTFYNSDTRAFDMPTEYSLEIDERHDALYARWLWDTNVVDHGLWRKP